MLVHEADEIQMCAPARDPITTYTHTRTYTQLKYDSASLTE